MALEVRLHLLVELVGVHVKQRTDCHQPRLVTLELLAKSAALAVPADAIRNNGRPTGLFAESLAAKKPPLFSKRFVEIVARSVEEGRVSIRKIANLLNLSVDDLGDLLAAHGVPATYEL